MKVGYKKQSAISNLENRASGTGGRRIAMIAFVLRVPVQWLLSGPDGPDVPYAENLYDGSPSEVSTAVALPGATIVHTVSRSQDGPDGVDPWTREAVKIMRGLQAHERPGAIAHLRTYVTHLGPTC